MASREDLDESVSRVVGLPEPLRLHLRAAAEQVGIANGIWFLWFTAPAESVLGGHLSVYDLLLERVEPAHSRNLPSMSSLGGLREAQNVAGEAKLWRPGRHWRPDLEVLSRTYLAALQTTLASSEFGHTHWQRWQYPSHDPDWPQSPASPLRAWIDATIRTVAGLATVRPITRITWILQGRPSGKAEVLIPIEIRDRWAVVGFEPAETSQTLRQLHRRLGTPSAVVMLREMDASHRATGDPRRTGSALSQTERLLTRAEGRVIRTTDEEFTVVFGGDSARISVGTFRLDELPEHDRTLLEVDARVILTEHLSSGPTGPSRVIRVRVDDYEGSRQEALARSLSDEDFSVADKILSDATDS